MMHWDGEWGWGPWLAMSLVMIAFWGVLAWAVVALVRGSRSEVPAKSADQILDERLARGEISVTEYEERRAALK